jgi:hypothetical protein
LQRDGPWRRVIARWARSGPQPHGRVARIPLSTRGSGHWCGSLTSAYGPRANWGGTCNLTPLRRYSHRVKTRGGWKVRRLDDGSLEWTTKHGLKFLIDHNGTHPITDQP